MTALGAGLTAGLLVWLLLRGPGPRLRGAMVGSGEPARPRRRHLGAIVRGRSAAPPRPAGKDEDDDVAAFLEILASGLRAGRTPPEAARLACDVVDGEPVARLRAAVDRGEDLGAALGASARTDPRWRMVAHAWALSARTGAPLADAMDAAAGVVRAHQDRARHVESASAGARATIRILTALPLGGPVLALAVGVDPAGAYASPTAWACLVGGVVLVLVGRRWVASLVRSAVTGPVLAAR